jgi:hypothetical protein
MLLIQALAEDRRIDLVIGDQVFVGRPLAGENGAAIVDQGHYDRPRKTFIFGLHVISLSLELYVGVKAGDHVK